MAVEVKDKEAEAKAETAFEESWAASVASLRKAVGDDEDKDKKKKLAKAKADEEASGDPDNDKEPDDDEDDEDKEEEPVEAQKSVEDIVGEDAEAQAAMDVEPFLRSLVKAIDIVMAASLGESQRLRKSLKQVKKMMKAQGSLTIKTAEMQKSMSDVVTKMGLTPMPILSRISIASGQKFAKAQGSKEWTRDELLKKSVELVQSGGLDVKDASLLELKLNHQTFNPEMDAFSKSIIERFESALTK